MLLPNGFISEPSIRRMLSNRILPAWSGREFTSIKRGDVAALLDKVSDNAGPVAADRVLAVISSISNWYATRNDTYVSPVEGDEPLQQKETGAHPNSR